MDSSNSFANPAKPFDIINHYLQHPTQLTSLQLAQLEHATKLSRINYSEGDIRCEYDQAINMTLKLLDSLELYFLLSPAHAEKKINRIIAKYKLAFGEIEKFESCLDFNNLSQVQFEQILNERKKLYNVLLGEINRQNIVETPKDNGKVERKSALKAYSFHNSAQKYKQFKVRCKIDMQLHVPSVLREKIALATLGSTEKGKQLLSDLEQLESAKINTGNILSAEQNDLYKLLLAQLKEELDCQISTLNHKFIEASINQYCDFDPSSTFANSFIAFPIRKLKLVINELQDNLKKAMGRDITYSPTVSKKDKTVVNPEPITHTSLGKDGLIDPRNHLDMKKVTVGEYSSASGRDIVHIKIAGIPGRRELGRRMLSEPELNDYWLLYSAITFNELDPSSFNIKQESADNVPHWFREMKLGKQVLLLQMLKQAALHASRTVDQVLQELPALTNDSSIQNDLIEQVFKEYVDAYEKSPSNDGRDTPGVGSPSESRSIFFERNKTDGTLRCIYEGKVGNFNNYGCPVRSGTHLMDDDLRFAINNILQDFPLRLSAHKEWLDKTFPKGKVDYSQAIFSFISVCLLSPNKIDDVFEGKYGSNNNKTMSAMAQYAHTWINYQVENGRFLDLMKEVMDWEATKKTNPELVAYLEQVGIVANTCVHGVNFFGRNAGLFGSDLLARTTGSLSVINHVCNSLKIFAENFSKLADKTAHETAVDLEAGEGVELSDRITQGNKKNSTNLEVPLVTVPFENPSDNLHSKELIDLLNTIRTKLSKLSIMHNYMDLDYAEIQMIKSKVKQLIKLAEGDGREPLKELSAQVEAASEYLYYLNIERIQIKIAKAGYDWVSFFAESSEVLREKGLIDCFAFATDRVAQWWRSSARDTEINIQQMRGALALLCFSPYLRKAWCKSCHDRAQLLKAYVIALEVFKLQEGRLPNNAIYNDMVKLADIAAHQIFIAQTSAVIRSVSVKGAGGAIKSVVKEQGAEGVAPPAAIKGGLDRINAKAKKAEHPEIGRKLTDKLVKMGDCKPVKTAIDKEKAVLIHLSDYVELSKLAKVIKEAHDEYKYELVENYLPRYLEQILDADGLASWAEKLNSKTLLELTFAEFKKYLHKPTQMNLGFYQTIYNYLENNFSNDAFFDVTSLSEALDSLRPDGSVGCKNRMSMQSTFAHLLPEAQGFQQTLFYADEIRFSGAETTHDERGNNDYDEEGCAALLVESQSASKSILSQAALEYLNAGPKGRQAVSLVKHILDQRPIMQQDLADWAKEQSEDFLTKVSLVALLEGHLHGDTLSAWLSNWLGWVTTALKFAVLGFITGYGLSMAVNNSPWNAPADVEAKFSNVNSGIMMTIAFSLLACAMYIGQHLNNLTIRLAVINAENHLSSIDSNDTRVNKLMSDFLDGLSNHPRYHSVVSVVRNKLQLGGYSPRNICHKLPAVMMCGTLLIAAAGSVYFLFAAGATIARDADSSIDSVGRILFGLSALFLIHLIRKTYPNNAARYLGALEQSVFENPMKRERAVIDMLGSADVKVSSKEITHDQVVENPLLHKQHDTAYDSTDRTTLFNRGALEEESHNKAVGVTASKNISVVLKAL